MTSQIAIECIRQLRAQKASLENSIADSRARLVIIDAQLAAILPLVEPPALADIPNS